MHVLRSTHLLVRVALFCLASAVLGQSAGAHPAEAHYVGSDTCRSCHDEQYESFSASAHAKLLDNKEPAQQGCEACHGAGAEHVNGNGDAEKIFRFQNATKEVVRSRCGACHSDLSANVHKQHSISCLSCHSAHRYAEKKFLLLKATPALCQTCHR